MQRRLGWSLALALSFGAALAAAEEGWETERETIEIQRIEPKEPRKPTLRFLHENLEFLRARLDPLREVREREMQTIRELDPTLLRYLALGRSLTAAEQARARLSAEGADRDAMMESVRALAALESELDRISALLDSAAVRVGILEDDFVGRQETTLLCLLRARAEASLPDQVSVRAADGRVSALLLDDEDARVLRRGGILQIWHDFLEPRVQTLQLALGSASGGTEVGYLQLDPLRDHLNVLEIDISNGTRVEDARVALWSHPGTPAEADVW